MCKSRIFERTLPKANGHQFNTGPLHRSANQNIQPRTKVYKIEAKIIKKNTSAQGRNLRPYAQQSAKRIGKVQGRNKGLFLGNFKELYVMELR